MIKILQGDSLKILPQLPAGSIDFILTDPPYFEKKSSIRPVDISGIGALLYRVAKQDTFLISDCFRKSVCRYIDLYKPFVYHDMMITYVMNSMTSCKVGFDCFIPSLIFKKGKPKVRHHYLNVIRTARRPYKGDGSVKVGHPAVKYLNTYLYLVYMFTNEGDIVLDPFLGSGTSAIACKVLKRQFIGIEIEEQYVKLTQRALSKVSSADCLGDSWYQLTKDEKVALKRRIWRLN